MVQSFNLSFINIRRAILLVVVGFVAGCSYLSLETGPDIKAVVHDPKD